VYLRDQDTGEYWSPTWQPVPERKLDFYECRHGPGYTRITSRFKGMRAELLYFVPPAGPNMSKEVPCELWVLRLRNSSRRPRTVRSFSYAEFSNWNAEADLNNLDWGQHVLRSRVENGIIRMSTTFRPTTTFMGSSLPPVGFDTDREVFTGRYRDLSNPVVVEQGRPQNSQAARGNNVGGLCHQFNLQPGEQVELIYILGVTDDPGTIDELVAHFINAKNTWAAFNANKLEWGDYLDRFQVHTPDEMMNAMLNAWNQVQCRATLFWSRRFGLRNRAGAAWARDSAQDTLAVAQNALGGRGKTSPACGSCSSAMGTPGIRCSHSPEKAVRGWQPNTPSARSGSATTICG
jgi:cellobiose phosphorylase